MRDINGQRLVPGRNVDKVDIAAGVRFAARFGYGSPVHRMVIEYALMRHARGEEDGAEKTALHEGIDLTSWYAIRACAVAAGERMTLEDLTASVNPDDCQRA